MTHLTHPTDPLTEALIGEIAEDFTQQLARGNHPEVESYVSRYPEYEEVLRQVLPALQAIRPQQTQSAFGGTDSLGIGGGEPVSRVLGDFRLLREVGRGGMGIVYEAEQISLQRRVALKVLPLASVLDERRLQRFRNEALAAAQLNHPHIVDVLGVGSERGVHYYAMRFIEGRTVADLIAAERDSNNADRPASTVSAQRPVEEIAAADTRPIAGLSTERQKPTPERFRRLAEMFADIADALDHAHQHGIVHRDVKPSNLIIDQAGKVWVCDFGLAQIDNGAAGLTCTGDLVGTLRFLSPEQVSTRNLVIDGRVDVYALGATLYETMTLQPAFDSETRPELLKQIITSEPKPPRRIDPGIPEELETIVLKSLSKSPQERYESAGDFAEDLRRFATDKPIRARRPNLKQRVSRWARHHRGLVQMAAVVALLFAIGSGVAAVSIDAARRDAIASKEQAEDAAELANREWTNAERLRIREEKNFRRAMRAVDLMLTRVAENKLANGPGMLEERRELLQEALAIYQEFLAQRRHDKKVRLETVRANLRVGQILLLQGRLKQARVAYEESMRVAIRGARQPGANKTDYDIQRAVASHNLGMIAFAMGKSRDAGKHYVRSLAIVASLPKGKQRALEVRRIVPAGHNNLGNVVYQRGDFRSAVRHYRKAIDGFSELVKDYPRVPSHRVGLATAHCSYARYCSSNGRTAESGVHYGKALKIQKELAERLPRVPKFRRALARTYGSLGDTQRKLRQLEQSRNSFRNAIALQSKLTRHYSEVPDFSIEVARVHNTYSFLLKRLGDLDQAIRHSRKALDIRLRLAADHPNLPRFQLGAAGNRRHLANLLVKAKVDEADSQFAQSIDALQPLAKAYPKLPMYRAELAESYLDLGRFQRAAKKYQQSERNLRAAIRILRRLTTDKRALPRYRTLLVKSRWHLAMVFSSRREIESATELFATNVDDMRKLVKEFPQVESHRHDLCGCLYNLALMQLRRRHLPEAESLIRENLTVYATLMQSASRTRKYRIKFRTSLLLWGGMLNMLKRRPSDGIECLAIASYAWKRDNARLTKLWFQRALTKPTRDRVVFDRVLEEVRLLTGLRSKTERAPVSAVKPKVGRPRG